MMTILASLLVLAGSLFALIAAIGVVRMPDVYCRMHAATKAGAFGVLLLLIALVVASPGPRVIVEGALIVAFFYLTAPVAAQMLGRAALLTGIRPWRAPDDNRDAGSSGGSTNRAGGTTSAADAKDLSPGEATPRPAAGDRADQE